MKDSPRGGKWGALGGLLRCKWLHSLYRSSVRRRILFKQLDPKSLLEITAWKILCRICYSTGLWNSNTSLSGDIAQLVKGWAQSPVLCKQDALMYYNSSTKEIEAGGSNKIILGYVVRVLGRPRLWETLTQTNNKQTNILCCF